MSTLLSLFMSPTLDGEVVGVGERLGVGVGVLVGEKVGVGVLVGVGVDVDVTVGIVVPVLDKTILSKFVSHPFVEPRVMVEHGVVNPVWIVARVFAAML